MSIKLQSQIVKERLHYHFAKVGGVWNIPKDMPFMNEFLNCVDKLCKMTETEDLILNNSVVKQLEKQNPQEEKAEDCSLHNFLRGFKYTKCVKCRQDI